MLLLQIVTITHLIVLLPFLLLVNVVRVSYACFLLTLSPSFLRRMAAKCKNEDYARTLLYIADRKEDKNASLIQTILNTYS